MNEPTETGKPLSVEERKLDRQPVANEDRLELEELAQMLNELWVGRDADEAGYEGWPDYFESVLGGLPVVLDAEVDSDRATFEAAGEIITGRHNDKFKLNLHVDQAFGNNVQKVKASAQRMLDQASKGQAPCFYSRAKQKGLTWRRSRNLPFPHPLPYRTPSPTTNEGRYQEEAAVVQAAVQFACTRPTPTPLHINHFADTRRVLGSAIVNLYHRSKLLRIKLNGTHMGQYGHAEWSSVIAHEILHNLGWGHPKGSYPASLAIEIYQHCIEQGGDDRVESDYLNYIR